MQKTESKSASQMQLGNSNYVEITGIIRGRFSFSHRAGREKFYEIGLSSERLSGTVDILPLLVPERLINVYKEYEEQKVAIVGRFHSYRLVEAGMHKLMLSVAAREIALLGPDDEEPFKNQIGLAGQICKPPNYRRTPRHREITDLLLVVKRPDRSPDFIPCICWGRNAKYVSRLEVGAECALWGRIQSRTYSKQISEDHISIRTAYEVSVNKVLLF